MIRLLNTNVPAVYAFVQDLVCEGTCALLKRGVLVPLPRCIFCLKFSLAWHLLIVSVVDRYELSYDEAGLSAGYQLTMTQLLRTPRRLNV